MAPLAGQVVLVTGGGSGIGRAIALRAARDGAAVAVTGRRSGPLEETVALVERTGGTARAFPGDLLLPDEPARVTRAVAAALGPAHALVNNAGVAYRGCPADRTTDAQWDETLDLDLKAAWSLCRAVLPEMCSRGSGVILNVASNLGIVALPGMAAYVAAKSALLGLTRSLALDYGRHGVRANAVCPGLVLSPMTEGLPDLAEKERSYRERAALPRVGSPEDVAGLAVFLLGPEAAWITGQSIPVDGGYTIQ